jgi:hypothetical protein
MDTPIENLSKKYPISVHNRQCIGPCYPANENIVHPITLTGITRKKPFCPVDQWLNEETKQWEFTDECYLPSKGTKDQEQKMEYNLLVPTFNFNCEYFLKIFYNIFSFETAIDWLSENSQDPIYTQLRIIECAWRLYGNNSDILNDQLLDFYIMIIKKEWIKDIYPQISKYIYIDENQKVYLKANKEDQKNQVEKINYFIQKFVTKQTIYQVLDLLIKENNIHWNTVNSFNKTIKELFIKYIIEKIEVTLKNE